MRTRKRLRRVAAVTALALLPLGSATPAAAGTNLLTNPGFETGSYSPWVPWGDSCTHSVGAAYKRSLSYGFRLVDSSASVSCGLRQDFSPITTGTSYTATVWANAVNNGVPFTAAQLHLEWTDGDGNRVGTVLADTTTTFGWKQLMATGIAPAGATKARIWFYVPTSHTAEVYYDDATLEAATPPPPPPGPPNNDFANAVTVSAFPYTTSLSTSGATRQTSEPQVCGGIGGTVWYRWVAPSTRTVIADTFGSTYDTVLAAYSGTSLTGLTSVACNDQANGGNQSRIEFLALSGSTYYFQVGGFNGATGNATVNIMTPAGPANDDFASSTVIGSLPYVNDQSTQYASSQPGEQLLCGGGATSVWYSYTHPASAATRRLFLNTFGGTTFDSTLTVWRGSALGSLTSVACNNDARGVLQSQLSWLAQPGVTYHIQAAGRSNQTGLLRLRLVEGSIVALGDSVVAGHGLGPNPNGYPNNPTSAYSQLAGNDLGLRVYNLARTGSCASNRTLGNPNTPQGCDARSVMADQIGAIPVTPTHVIVGAGGNDIEFSTCLEGFMSWDGTSNDAEKEKMDRCRTPGPGEPATPFANRLAALSANLDKILYEVGRLSTPSPYVTVVGYYNPFSDAPTDPNQVCDMWMPAAMARNRFLATKDHNGTDYRLEVLKTQREGFAYARDVVTALNNTIKAAALARGATFVETATAFVGHDICRTLRDRATGLPGNTADTWVYGPEWRDEYDDPFQFPRAYTSRPMPDHCPYPTYSDQVDRHIDRSTIAWDYDMYFSTNCLAHPTASGHQALAGLVKPSLLLT